jgi:hypothetical protein
MSRVAIGVLCVAVLVPASSSSEVVGCTVLLDQAQSPQQQRPDQRPEQRPPIEQPPARPPAKVATEALRAPQEKELTELAGVLKAIANVETAPAVLEGLRAGKPFSLERFGVLVADVRSIVVLLDARELRKRLDGRTEVSAETRQGIDQSVRVMEGCAPGRFENRGGPIVVEQVTALVQKHRGQLVPFLFQSATQQEAPVPAPQKQRKQGG